MKAVKAYKNWTGNGDEQAFYFHYVCFASQSEFSEGVEQNMYTNLPCHVCGQDIPKDTKSMLEEGPELAEEEPVKTQNWIEHRDSIVPRILETSKALGDKLDNNTVKSLLSVINSIAFSVMRITEQSTGGSLITSMLVLQHEIQKIVYPDLFVKEKYDKTVPLT